MKTKSITKGSKIKVQGTTVEMTTKQDRYQIENLIDKIWVESDGSSDYSTIAHNTLTQHGWSYVPGSSCTCNDGGESGHCASCGYEKS